MSIITTDQGLAIPIVGDNANVPVSVGALMGANPTTGASSSSGMESRLVKRYLSAADRTARNGSPATGELSWRADLPGYEYYTGSVWTALSSKGFVSEITDTTSNVSTTTTEIVSTSIQISGIIGTRYKVSYAGVSESNTAGDISTLRLRWKTTAVVDISGTIFATNNKTAAIGGKGDAFTLFGTFIPLSTGTVTIVATIQRILGSGTVKQNGSSPGQSLYFLVESV
jgi:hypothetical protein